MTFDSNQFFYWGVGALVLTLRRGCCLWRSARGASAAGMLKRGLPGRAIQGFLSALLPNLVRCLLRRSARLWPRALPIPFDGFSGMEVDLLCDKPRRAVEVDGPQHLGDPAAYRRDRRKEPVIAGERIYCSALSRRRYREGSGRGAECDPACARKSPLAGFTKMRFRSGRRLSSGVSRSFLLRKSGHHLAGQQICGSESRHDR